ncbi:MAG: ATP-dependent sacrificial sulfur transferase LarE, partial [Candidatus Saccharicenans sp.]
MKARAKKTGVIIPTKILGKYRRLKKILKSLDSVLVALSGGVDSSLLLKAAEESLDGRVMAAVIKSPIFYPEEMETARKIARKLGVRLKVIESDDYLSEEFRKNEVLRCYYCKMLLFKRLKKLAKSQGLATVVEGSNLDDEFDFRPGKKALKELGIRSPLREAGLKKAEIRLLARAFGLTNWNWPSNACLATRIPFGQPIELKWLRKISRAEHFLKSLGFSQVRVRHHGEIARLEVWPEDIFLVLKPEIRLKINRRLKNLGWRYVTFDLEG